MTLSSAALDALQAEISELFSQLPHLKHGELIQQALKTLVRMAETEGDRLDWKILNASLQDMEQAFRTFYPYRHIRKIAIFGSARIPRESVEYQMASDFAKAVTQHGFMVITGGGPGIMQAGNEGAGAEHSFGLGIQLPFEEGSNLFMSGDPKLISFKYFFTRKLFFLRESDALGLFPGGFGTQDEAFECLTLMQTGKTDFLPLVLIDPPGVNYWQGWETHIRDHLLKPGLISAEDLQLYTITDQIDVACEAITSFYRMFHSSRYVEGRLVIRLNSEPSDLEVEQLNQEFSDILLRGRIEKIQALPPEIGSETEHLPRIALFFNQRNFGRLYQMLRAINQLEPDAPATHHPEQK